MFLKYLAKMHLILILSKFSGQIVGSPNVLCSIQQFFGHVIGKCPMLIRGLTVYILHNNLVEYWQQIQRLLVTKCLQLAPLNTRYKTATRQQAFVVGSWHHGPFKLMKIEIK